MNGWRDRNLVNKTICAWWLSKVVVFANAQGYVRPAQRDECNGFPYTAALEWRYAAEVSAPRSAAAEYCWQQWERIMRLPRRLGGSLGVPPHSPEKSFMGKGKTLRI